MAFTVPCQYNGRIIEKEIKKQFEKSVKPVHDLVFEFDKEKKDFMKFRNQIGKFCRDHRTSLLCFNFYGTFPRSIKSIKLYKAQKIQREFNKMSQSESDSQIYVKIVKTEKMSQSESDSQIYVKIVKTENENLNARINKLEKTIGKTQEDITNLDKKFDDNSKKLEQIIALLTAEKS